MEFKKYFKQLFKPWKVATLVIATGALTYIGTIANDPTWDVYVSIIMSVLTYVTAPLLIVSFYKSVVINKFSENKLDLSLGIFLYYLTVSLSYELYNLYILGAWPASHTENFYISSAFYISAGLFWGADFDEMQGSYLHQKRKIIYIATSIFTALSFLYFGLVN